MHSLRRHSSNESVVKWTNEGVLLSHLGGFFQDPSASSSFISRRNDGCWWVFEHDVTYCCAGWRHGRGQRAHSTRWQHQPIRSVRELRPFSVDLCFDLWGTLTTALLSLYKRSTLMRLNLPVSFILSAPLPPSLPPSTTPLQENFHFFSKFFPKQQSIFNKPSIINFQEPRRDISQLKL